MPINRKKKLIFIHIPKNGGTSVAKSLHMLSHWRKVNLDKLYGITSDNIVLQSLQLKFYDKYISDNILKECDIFTVVRNPYDRVLSDYSYNNRGFEKLIDYLVYIKKKLENTDEYELMKYNRRYLNNHILPQYKYIESDKYNVNFIIKFENFSDDFKSYFPEYDLAHTNKSKHVSHKVYFKDKPKCINLINQIYKKDFEMFNYEMIKTT